VPYYRRNFRRIVATRTRLSRALTTFGFRVCPSQTNFILVTPPGPPAEQWLTLLRQERILVRWFNVPDVKDSLRITIGSDQEADALLSAVRRILRLR
jgi:histidinol-phosphate aminotransferase